MSDYEVGYKKPPKEHQFKKGQSGKPTGRPKKKTELALPVDFADLVLTGAERRIQVGENGKTVKLSIAEGILRRLEIQALKGDKGAAKIYLGLLQAALECARLNPSLRPQPAPDLSGMDVHQAAEAYRRFMRGE